MRKDISVKPQLFAIAQGVYECGASEYDRDSKSHQWEQRNEGEPHLRLKIFVDSNKVHKAARMVIAHAEFTVGEAQGEVSVFITNPHRRLKEVDEPHSRFILETFYQHAEIKPSSEHAAAPMQLSQLVGKSLAELG